ncbi:MAG: hypothetical protein IKM46_08775 [Clostridia bacterium]|nr:hypothetical protein [Clostridia bacterium]
MTELEKIEYAKSFIDKLACGVNPLDGSCVPQNEVVNNVRISRCFSYVSEILRQVIENGGTVTVKQVKTKKSEFFLSDEQKVALSVSEIPLTVSEITEYLNSFVDTETMKKIASTWITRWLVKLGFLDVVALPNGKSRKTPTKQGWELGIFTEERVGQYGPYVAVLYRHAAQQFIYDNIDAIMAFKVAENESKNSKAEYRGQKWTDDQDVLLRDMYSKNTSVEEMATILKRSDEGVRSRLKKLGLVENRSDAL